MVFSSLLFIFIFLPITLITYYIVPQKLKNLVLFISSLIFYAWGEPLYILLMIFSTVFNYFIGLFIHKNKKKTKKAKLLFIISIIVNLGILSFFKYYGFIVDNINNIFGLSINAIKLPLPVGISFYTFQTMSYIIDVYLDKVSVQKNFISFGTYVTMFPQLVAGPIVQYDDIKEQLDKRKENLPMFAEGIEVFIIGLSKKVLLANNIGLLWDSIKSLPIKEVSLVTSWIGIIGFTLQIYFDFSGYSDMAMGLGKMFGFELMQNFNYPYISKSVTEFWRRWHISLGNWFREYVYIPLGGNRNGKLNQYKNLFVVWFLTGLWHGASWNFVLWGLYFGFFVTIEKVFLLKWLKNKPNIIGHIYTLIIVIVGWALFQFENIKSCMIYIKNMFGIGTYSIIDKRALYYINTNYLLFIILIICSTPLLKKIWTSLKEKNKKLSMIISPIIYMILIFMCTAYLVNESYNPFLYFKF